MSENALSGRYEGICTDKSANCGIIIAGLEIIEAGFAVVDISTVAERIMQTQCAGHRAGDGEQSAPSIVG